MEISGFRCIYLSTNRRDERRRGSMVIGGVQVPRHIDEIVEFVLECIQVDLIDAAVLFQAIATADWWCWNGIPGVLLMVQLEFRFIHNVGSRNRLIVVVVVQTNPTVALFGFLGVGQIVGVVNVLHVNRIHAHITQGHCFTVGRTVALEIALIVAENHGRRFIDVDVVLQFVARNVFGGCLSDVVVMTRQRGSSQGAKVHFGSSPVG